MIGVKKKEDIFFDLFREAMAMVIVAGEAFQDLVEDYTDVKRKVDRLKELETECDKETHKILEKLNVSFITPFDREDIYEISRQMDDIVDMLEEVAARFLVFDVRAMRPEAMAMARLITTSIRELKILFDHLQNLTRNHIVMDQVIEVNRLENDGDLLYRDALARLFREEKDPIEIIKWKQIFDLLEDSIDACEGVANIIEGVVMKHA